MGYLLPGVIVPFLKGRSSFPSAFRLDAPFLMTLRVDKDAPSLPFSFFSSFLRTVADAFTNTLCLVASIFVKDKGQELDTKMTRK